MIAVFVKENTCVHYISTYKYMVDIFCLPIYFIKSKIYFGHSSMPLSIQSVHLLMCDVLYLLNDSSVCFGTEINGEFYNCQRHGCNGIGQ